MTINSALNPKGKVSYLHLPAKRNLVVPEKRVANLIPVAPREYRRKDAKMLPKAADKTIQQRVLRFLRDNVHSGIPRAYKKLVLGHDVHVSIWATLRAKHFHYWEADPLTGEPGGWWEDYGLVSEALVTTAFTEFMVDEMQTESSEWGDANFHRVGTDNTAEANTHTALQADSGITGVSGTQGEGASANIYQSVATVTADASETWQEHGLFTQAGTSTPAGTMVDRNLISPTVAVVSSDTVEFTYELTVNPET